MWGIGSRMPDGLDKSLQCSASLRHTLSHVWPPERVQSAQPFTIGQKAKSPGSLSSREVHLIQIGLTTSRNCQPQWVMVAALDAAKCQSIHPKYCTYLAA